MEQDTAVDVDCRQNVSKRIYHSVSVVLQWNCTPLLTLTEDMMLAARYITVLLLFNSGTEHRC